MGEQPKETIDKIHELLLTLNFWNLTVLEAATRNCKSLIVGMGLLNGDIPTAERALEISHLEELHQMSFWGEDPSWLDRKKSILSWLDACKKMSELKLAHAV